jgi:nitroimidazol reductase NimA-like FMN-containing flavoprotein (pyridoxamine 5'-phosphate oxidase superfamily)
MDTTAPQLTADQLALAEEVLLKAPSAFVAMVEHAAPPASASPYVVPMNFAYLPAAPSTAAAGRPGTRPGRVFLHTGAGRKTQALALNPLVSIVVTAEERFVKGASPCDDGFAFRSVLLSGRAVRLEDDTEREQALRAIVGKYDPQAAGRPLSEDALDQTLVYAVEVETLSYRERPRRS